MLIILFWLTKLGLILQLLNLKWIIALELLSIGLFLVKFILKIGHEKYLWFCFEN